MRAKVAVLKTRPETVLADYAKLMRLADYQHYLPKDKDTALKINISWQQFYPACSTTPWQLEGVIKTLLADGYQKGLIHGCHNKTVVVSAKKGEIANKHKPVLEKYGLRNVHLYEGEEWIRYEPKAKMLVLDQIFPDGIQIPKRMIGENIIHLPTMKCVAPASEVILENGETTSIKELVEERMKEKKLFVDNGDEYVKDHQRIFSLEQNRIEPQNATHFWRVPAKNKKIVRLKLKTGRWIETSLAHPFLTPGGWKKAKNLEKGGRLAIPRKIKIAGRKQALPRLDDLYAFGPEDVNPIMFRQGKKYSIALQKRILTDYLNGLASTRIAKKYGIPWQATQLLLKKYKIPSRGHKKRITLPTHTSCEFWRWLGYFFAEGWIQKMHTSCRFWWTNADERICSDFIKLTTNLFGIKIKRRKNQGIDYYFDSLEMEEFFGKLGLELPFTAGVKKAPPLLFKCTQKEIAAFLQGYLDGDGTVAKDGAHVTTKSKVLAAQLHYLFARLGLICFQNTTWNRPNKESAKRKYYQVSIYGDELIRLSKFIDFTCKHKAKNLKALIKKRRKSKRPTNWDTLPVNSEIFRMVRLGLGFTQDSSGKPSAVNSIENCYSLPTRPVFEYFIRLFRQADRQNKFEKEIKYFEFLANEQIAWDHIEDVQIKDSPHDYFYDLTVPGAHNFIANLIFCHNTHVFTTMTGAMKNAFGGLLHEKRHWTHSVIHETLVDLLTIQKEIHRGIFAVMDGTFAGDGPGPRCMVPYVKDYILASADQVAIDAIAAKMMGFDPLSLKFIRLAHEAGLGVGDPQEIEIVGEDISDVNFHFHMERTTFASRGQAMIYWGPLKPLENFLLRTVLAPWSYLASIAYHDYYWYPFVGRARVEAMLKTGWGKLFLSY